MHAGKRYATAYYIHNILLTDVAQLKGQYKTVRNLLEASGFGWDPEKCKVTAPDDVWDCYIESHTNAAYFRDNPFPFMMI